MSLSRSDGVRPLLLGECPSQAGDRYHAFPLSGAIGKRLCQWAEIQPKKDGTKYGQWYWALLDHFDCVNTIERYDDSVPWKPEIARARVWHYLDENPTDTVVALGIRAFDALAPNLRGQAWGEWARSAGRSVVVIPHPSGRCRLYNDPEMRDLASRVLKEARYA